MLQPARVRRRGFSGPNVLLFQNGLGLVFKVLNTASHTVVSEDARAVLRRSRRTFGVACGSARPPDRFGPGADTHCARFCQGGH